MIGKQRVELLMNSVGKRTVVLLNPSFFYFFNPFFVTGNPIGDRATIKLTDLKPPFRTTWTTTDTAFKAIAEK